MTHINQDIDKVFTKLKGAADSPTVRVMKALKIGSKDIELNQQGELSELQKHQLRRQFIKSFLFTAAFGVYLSLWAIVLLSSGIPVPQRAAHPAIWFVIALIISMVIGGLFAVERHRKNLKTGHVVAFTGRVKKYREVLIVINYDQKIECIYPGSKAPIRAFLEGETYTCYSPSFDRDCIIAAEHIASSTPPLHE